MPFTRKTARKAGKKSSRKGVPNNATTEIKAFYTALLAGQAPRVEKELEKLTGKAYLDAIFKLSEYVLPKQRQVEQIIDVSQLSDDEVEQLIGSVLENLD